MGGAVPQKWLGCSPYSERQVNCMSQTKRVKPMEPQQKAASQRSAIVCSVGRRSIRRQSTLAHAGCLGTRWNERVYGLSSAEHGSLPARIEHLVIQSLGGLTLKHIQGDEPPEFEFFHRGQMKPVEGAAVSGLRTAMLPKSC